MLINEPIHSLQILSRAGMMILLIAAAACVGPQPRPVSQPLVHKNKPHIRIVELEKKIHVLVNKERQQHGLAPVSFDHALVVIARKHSRDMANRKYFDHISPEGYDFAYRYRNAGYSCAIPDGSIIYAGAENIALNNLYDSVTTVNGKAFYDWNSEDRIAETTVQGWMKSPGHRKNILTPHWRNEGIGIVISPDDKVYITQNFC